MGFEEDVREIRRMFAAHVDNEAKAFENNAKEHGVILTKLEGIEKRLEDGSVNFDDHETRLQVIEKQIANWKGWGAAVVLIAGAISGASVKFFDFIVNKIWPHAH